MGTEQLRREYDLTVRYRVFPLHPDIPEAGIPLDELFAGRLDVPAMISRLQKVAGELNLPLGERTRTYNSRRAQELGRWAEEQRCGAAFHDAVYRAYFVDGRNIGRIEVLADIAAGIGLDDGAARDILQEGRYAAAVAADWQHARKMGVSAVPTLQYGRRRLVGFHPFDESRKLIAPPSG